MEVSYMCIAMNTDCGRKKFDICPIYNQYIIIITEEEIP